MNIKEQINLFMTKDLEALNDENLTAERALEIKDRITDYEDIMKECDSLDKEKEALKEENAILRDKVVDSIKHFGTGKKPESETPQDIDSLVESVFGKK